MRSRTSETQKNFFQKQKQHYKKINLIKKKFPHISIGTELVQCFFFYFQDSSPCTHQLSVVFNETNSEILRIHVNYS
jgi:hypothetical protein